MSLAPEAALLSGYLRPSIQLVDCTHTHKEVHDHQVIVNGVNLCSISRPDEAGTADGDLLVHTDVLSWLGEISDVSDGDHPLEGRGPEENSEGAGGVQQ